ncbi:hypothetical protein H4R22_004535 [Coemansia sp. RSA 1290]|nr:hypothetical protein H4R22_004535 [Coemansia sp. RSA 1290]KAJ2650105.1 hypothetical protein IWW40_002651 [Coemansia sp. RSA 1250]KAJ2674669.1 hypothetical protein IWW42_001515 [Coemansia sp. RSA 1085]
MATFDRLPFELIEAIASLVLNYRRYTFTPAIYQRHSQIFSLLSICSSWRRVAAPIFYGHAFAYFKQYQPPELHAATPYYQSASIMTNLDIIIRNRLGYLVKTLHIANNSQLRAYTPLECLLPCLALDDGNHRHMRKRGLLIREGQIENINELYKLKYSKLIRIATLSLYYSLPNVTRLSLNTLRRSKAEEGILGALANVFISQLHVLDCNMTPNFPNVRPASIRRLTVGQRIGASGHRIYATRTVDAFFIPNGIESLQMFVGQMPPDWGYFCSDAATGLRNFDSLRSLAIMDTFVNNSVFILKHLPSCELAFSSLTELTLKGLLIKPSFVNYFLQSPLKTLRYLDAIAPSIRSLLPLAPKLQTMQVQVSRPYIVTSQDEGRNALKPINELFGGASKAQELVLDIRTTRCIDLNGSWPYITRLSVMGKMDFGDFLDALFQMPNLRYVAISPCFSNEEECRAAGRELLGGKYKYANRTQSKVDVLSLVQSKEIQKSPIEQRLLVKFYRWNMDEIVWFFPNFKVIFGDLSLCIFS